MGESDEEGNIIRPDPQPDFMEPPKPISDREIAATETADVIVVGAGMSGMCAAISAAEEGAKVIPGLYAAGNNSGSFYANDYCMTIMGNSHGRAYTFGYLAGSI